MEEVLGELKEEGLYVEAEPEGKAGIREVRFNIKLILVGFTERGT